MQFFLYWNLIVNIELFLSPISFLYSHKTYHNKIRSYCFPKSSLKVTNIQTLSGLNMNLTQTQNEYFEELRNNWG
ncbi:unnamed protein product [Caenorhabditis angaria]|uniref:Uncharacterized protein n=1 Tax=Caenorhabditis angaria TaxID=860376 RepID=A0A9P1N8T5_9PELO|nr:unnamed protein product [Caenorhabditis angaria]